MISTELVKKILLGIPFVSVPSIEEHKVYEGNSYTIAANIDLDIRGKTVSVLVGIPENWERELFSIYLKDYKSLPFMPHVEQHGKLCLFELEAVLIDYNFKGLLIQCVTRAKDIIEKGLFEDNTLEFAREFTSYWSYQSNIRYMRFAVPGDHKTQVIKFINSEVTKKRNERAIDYLERSKSITVFGACDNNTFNTWKVKGQQTNGLYIYLRPDEYILPPDPKKDITVDYVNKLLGFAMYSDVKSLLSKIGNTVRLVFEIEEPGGENVCVGVIVKNSFLSAENGKLVLSQSDSEDGIIPLSVTRVDSEYLMRRTKGDNELKHKNCLVIGCGSIGGYLSSELFKSGWQNITLVDDDILKEENIYRHLLGIEYVGKYKANAIQEYFKKNLPDVEINSVHGMMEDLIEEGSIDLEDYDIFISATGNHNSNRWLNRYIHENKIYRPCFYLWNEPLDLGCHVAFISLRYDGCYDCFFDRDSTTNELYDRVSFSEPGQVITRNIRGCSNSFVPYSSNVSIKTVCLCIDLIDRYFTDRLNENILVSEKGDAYYFQKAGLKVSEVYSKQNSTIEYISGKDFKKIDCDICGE